MATANIAIAQGYLIERIASGLNQPTYVTQAPNDPSNILYYTERTQNANPGFGVANNMGRVWRYDVDTRTRTMVLDLSSRFVTNDTGLQTIAFHPDFNTPATAGYGKLYVSSSEASSTALNRVEEFTVDLSGPSPSYAATFTRLLLQYQNNAQNNHTIDWIGFDPTASGAERNYLYISTGDGSFGNSYNGGTSPTGRPSQNPNDVAGKMLRVDVVGADAYPGDALKNFAIPSTNPIPTYNAANPGSPISGLGEVWITGMRNVYRASFDRANGDLWMGDVGEVFVEEVGFIKAGSNVAGPPLDTGWPQREGTFESDVPGAPAATVNPFTGVTSLEPIQQFLHDGNGEAVIGGYRYRGPVAELQGQYFYADFVGAVSTSNFWMLDFDRDTDPASYNGNNGTNTEVTALWQSLVFDRTDPTYQPESTSSSSAGLDHIVSFGEDNAGNLYLVDFGNGSGFDGQYPGAGRGEIFRFVPLLDVTVSVNRETGEMTFSNALGQANDVGGYTLLSAAGAIDPDNLTPIAGNYDAMPSGDGSIDANNLWAVTSASGDPHEFSESSTGGPATLAMGEAFVLSPGDGWMKSFYEDLSLSLILPDGTEAIANVEFFDNTVNQPYDRSDLDFNRALDAVDWDIFRANHDQVMPGLTKVESYRLGDLDGDGDNDFFDFRLFQADYIAANGPGAFAALLAGIPEPSSLALLLTVAAGAAWFRTRRRGLDPLWLGAAVMAGANFLAPSASADMVRQYTFNEGTAEDAIGSADGTLNGNASIDLGVLNLPGETGDYVSLPGSTIAMTSLVDATFEAWFTWRGGNPWQRVWDFGNTNASDEGTDYFFYSPNGPGNDSRTAIRNSQFTENTANLLAAVTTDVTHHVAVVVDNNSNGGSDTIALYLDGQFVDDGPFIYAFSQLSNNLAYLGRSLWANDAYLNGSIDEFRIYNNALTAQEVSDSFAAGPVPVQLLEMEVDTFTGDVSVRNDGTTPIAFDYYRVTSTEGALDPDGWMSLDAQNVDAAGGGTGQSWDEAGGPDTNEVAELYLRGATNLNPGQSRELGQLFDPDVFGKRETGDLVFQYAPQGGTLRSGDVSYIIPPPLPGDYNDNGTVDAADYTTWRDHLGQIFQLPNEVDGVSPGMVTIEDYDQWKLHFGDALPLGGGSSAQAVAVPEPASSVILLLACLGARFLCARSHHT